MTEDIKKSYNYHKPSDDGLAKIKQLRAAYTALDNLVLELAPNSRERSTALTNLETSAMWAIKAVVINDPASTVDDPNVDNKGPVHSKETIQSISAIVQEAAAEALKETLDELKVK